MFAMITNNTIKIVFFIITIFCLVNNLFLRNASAIVAVFESVFAHVGKEIGGVDEVVEIIVVDVINLVFVANPSHMALEDEHYVLANTHYRIHVVSVDDSGDAKLVGDVAEQLVDDN